VPITHAIGAVVVTKAAWEKVPPSHRAGIGVIADDVFGRLKASSRDENRAAVDDIRKAGLEVVPIAPKDLAVFRDIGARAAQRGVGPLYSAELLQRVRKVVADVRAAPHAAGR
jgi:TRAP-type C4-dicarboxylate transport system substrate-binding protein